MYSNSSRRRTSTMTMFATAAMTALAAAVLLPGCSSQPSDDEVLQATVRIEVLSCGQRVPQFATGVVLDDGLVLTVAHTFADGDELSITTANPNRLDAERDAAIVYLDEDRDIAILRLQDPPGGLRLAELAELDEPNTVRYTTYREPTGPELLNAQVLQFTQITLDGTGERAGMELDAAIAKGDSGGPVLDDTNDVVGLVFAASRADERGWAIAGSELTSAVESVRSVPAEISWQPRC